MNFTSQIGRAAAEALGSCPQQALTSPQTLHGCKLGLLRAARHRYRPQSLIFWLFRSKVRHKARGACALLAFDARLTCFVVLCRQDTRIYRRRAHHRRRRSNTLWRRTRHPSALWPCGHHSPYSSRADHACAHTSQRVHHLDVASGGTQLYQCPVGDISWK